MLDQNTDRMWFVIGALVVGAGIILLANEVFPKMFGDISETMANVVNDASGLLDESEESNNIVWASSSNIFNNSSTWGYANTWRSANITRTPNQTIDGMDMKATRLQTTGGTEKIKSIITIIDFRNQVNGRKYVYYITIKNNGSTPIETYNNRSTRYIVQPKEIKRLRFVGTGSDAAHIQFQIVADDPNTNLDVYISDLKFGYYKDDLG